MSPDTGILEPYMYGIMASTLLSGVTIAQAYDYSQSYRSDRLWMKLLIASLTFLTILNAICNLITLHTKLIDNFGNFPGAFAGDASDMVQHFVGPLMCTIGQCSFLQRTYSAAKSKIILFGVGTLVLATLVAGWVEAVVSISPTPHLLTFVQIYSWMSCLCDVIISGIFIYSMKRLQRSPSEYELPAHSIAGKLLVMSFEASFSYTAALTSVFAILNAIFSKLGGHIGIFGLIFNFCLPNIFCITVLFVLNSRRHLRDAQDQNSSNSRGNTNRKPFAPGGSQAGQIEVTLQTFVQTEGPVESEDSKNRRDWPDDVPGRGSAPRAVTFDEVLPH